MHAFVLVKFKKLRNYLTCSEQLPLMRACTSETKRLATGLQDPVIPSERHRERNQKVPGQPLRPGPPCNILVSLPVSLRDNYRILKAGLPNYFYFVYDLNG
jgi:hypothetical protein